MNIKRFVYVLYVYATLGLSLSIFNDRNLITLIVCLIQKAEEGVIVQKFSYNGEILHLLRMMSVGFFSNKGLVTWFN